MKKITFFASVTFTWMITISSCKTSRQPQFITQTEAEMESTKSVEEPQISSYQGIYFFEGSLREGLEKAKAENKLVFVDCYTTWCGPCKILKLYTFRDANLGDYMKDNYVSLAIDMETTEGQILAKKYGIEAYPTLLFLDKYGRVLNHQVGGIGAEALLAKAEQTVRKKI